MQLKRLGQLEDRAAKLEGVHEAAKAIGGTAKGIAGGSCEGNRRDRGWRGS